MRLAEPRSHNNKRIERNPTTGPPPRTSSPYMIKMKHELSFHCLCVNHFDTFVILHTTHPSHSHTQPTHSMALALGSPTCDQLPTGCPGWGTAWPEGAAGRTEWPVGGSSSFNSRRAGFVSTVGSSCDEDRQGAGRDRIVMDFSGFTCLNKIEINFWL